MKFNNTKTKYTVLGLLLLVFLLLSFSVYILSASFNTSDQDLLKEYGDDLQISYVLISNNALRFVRFFHPDSCSALLVMVHGAPGSLTAFNSYLKDPELKKHFNMLSYDRPGYSNQWQDAVPGIREQAEILRELIDRIRLPCQDVYLLSHSYGCPIAALAGIQLDSQVKRHLMIAPVMNGATEKIFWFSKIPLLFPFKFISSNANKTASHEKLIHPKELQNLASVWSETNHKIHHIHGSRDMLAPIDNVEFCEKNFPLENYSFTIMSGKGHFILWTEANAIRDKLLSGLGGPNIPNF